MDKIPLDQTSLAHLLLDSCEHIPDTLAAICVDLNSGMVVASETFAGSTTEPDELARAATTLFRGDESSGLGRLWAGVGGSGDDGDEIILLEPERLFVFLRSGAPQAYAIVFVTSSAANVGLVIARSRSVKDKFDETLRQCIEFDI